MSPEAIPPNKRPQTNDPSKPTQTSISNSRNSNQQSDSQKNTTENNSKQIVDTIQNSSNGLKGYSIRRLVEQSQIFGEYLQAQELKTNQIRKFLDATNRVKFELTQIDENFADSDADKFSRLEAEIVMLRPKLVYAASKNKKQSEAITSLGNVLSAAIKKIKNPIQNSDDFKQFKGDFERLVQLIESIVAYHKAKGGE
jgi:CRISPR-associated protein Csm2